MTEGVEVGEIFFTEMESMTPKTYERVRRRLYLQE